MVSMPSRKRSRKRSPKRAIKKPERVMVQYAPLVTGNTPLYHCDNVRIGHNEYEFTLTIFHSPPILQPEQLELARKGRPIPLEPLAYVTIPAKAAPGLIDAFISQRLKYEAMFGPLKSVVR
jgi:hypothetical protein